MGGNRWAIPGQVEAENYDLGGQGVAYYDSDANNIGGLYRNDGVDLERAGSTTHNYNVGWIEPGEWLEYSVYVNTTQPYDFFPRVASINSTGRFKILVDGRDITGTVNVPNTGGWQTYQTIHIRDINLTKGPHVIRFEAVSGGFNFNHWSAWRAQNAGARKGIGQSNSLEAPINLYPNPITEGYVLVQGIGLAEKAAVTIYNLQGKQVYQGQVSKTNQRIDLQGLKAGIYFLNLVAGNRTKVSKIVIE